MKSPHESRTMLMTNSEAVHNLYGEISTERDGDQTHQCIQTNLADVICGGNPNDKILYPRSAKRRSASFPTPRSLERRHSLRLFGSTKRLQRCQSTKSLSKTPTTLQPNQQPAMVTDSSSSEYQSTDSSSPSKFRIEGVLIAFSSSFPKQKKVPLYSREFSDAAAAAPRRLKPTRRSSRRANGSTPRRCTCRASGRRRWITM